MCVCGGGVWFVRVRVCVFGGVSAYLFVCVCVPLCACVFACVLIVARYRSKQTGSSNKNLKPRSN